MLAAALFAMARAELAAAAAAAPTAACAGLVPGVAEAEAVGRADVAGALAPCAEPGLLSSLAGLVGSAKAGAPGVLAWEASGTATRGATAGMGEGGRRCSSASKRSDAS